MCEKEKNRILEILKKIQRNDQDNARLIEELKVLICGPRESGSSKLSYNPDEYLYEAVLSEEMIRSRCIGFSKMFGDE